MRRIINFYNSAKIIISKFFGKLRGWKLLWFAAIVLVAGAIIFIQVDRDSNKGKTAVIESAITKGYAGQSAIPTSLPIALKENELVGSDKFKVKLNVAETYFEFKGRGDGQFWIKDEMLGNVNKSAVANINGDSSIYKEIFPGVDSERQVSENNIKELLTLRDKNAQTEFSYSLSTSGNLEVALLGDKIVFIDKISKSKLVDIGRPMARDKQNNAYKFKFVLKDNILTLSPDSDLSNVAYPLVVDPDYRVISDADLSGGTDESGDIVRDKAGNYYSVYSVHDGTAVNQENIYIAKSTDQGMTWVENAISFGNTNTNIWPSMVIDSSDNLRVVWHSYVAPGGAFDQRYFNEVSIPVTSLGSVRPTISDVGGGGGALITALAVDSSNNLHITYQSTSGVFYRKSTNGVWGSSTTIQSGSIFCGSVDSADLVIDNADVASVVWRNGTSGDARCTNPPAGIYYGRIQNGAMGSVQLLYASNAFDPSVSYVDPIFPKIVVDTNNSLHVVFISGHDPRVDPNNGYSLVYIEKTAAGWQSAQEVYSTTASIYQGYQGAIALATDSTNRLNLIWNENRSDLTGVNIVKYLTRSPAGVWQATASNVVTSSASSVESLFIGDFIWSPYPKVGGISTNIPNTGFGFTYKVEGVGLKYYGGPTWPTPPPPAQVRVSQYAGYGADSATMTYRGGHDTTMYIDPLPSGTLSYTFYLYCNRNDFSVDYTNVPPDLTVTTTNNYVSSWGHTCVYAAGTTYYPKAIAVQGSYIWEAHNSVTPYDLTAAVTTAPSTGGVGTSRTITATVDTQYLLRYSYSSDIYKYRFWYNCDFASKSVADTIAQCGSPNETWDTRVASKTTAAHDFGPGTFKVKVIIEMPYRILPDDAIYSLTIDPAPDYTLYINSLSASPSVGTQPLNPNLTINYQANVAGPWDVYVYCKTANTSPDKIYLNQADANVGSAPGKSPPWFSGSISLASTCAYTGTNLGVINMRVVMKNSANTIVFDSAETPVEIQQPTYGLTVSASAGTSATTAISATFTSNQPEGVTMRYTMYCDRNDTTTVITPGWNNQVSTANRLNVALGNCTYSTAATYHPKVIVEYIVGTPVVQGNTVYTYIIPVTLTASISASPNPAVVNRAVVLTGSRASGTATGNLGYNFYCKDTDTTPIATFANVPETQKTANCTYSASGTFKGKVVIVQQGITAQATVTITVGNPTVSVVLSAIPTAVEVGAPISLSAVVSGTAQGQMYYDFYCLETDGVYARRIVSTLTTVQADNLCTYSAAGTVKARVKVTRESQVALGSATIMVLVAGTNGQIIFEEDGVAIKIRGSLVANQVVFAPRKKGSQQYSARIYSDKNVLASRLPGFSDIMTIINQKQ